MIGGVLQVFPSCSFVNHAGRRIVFLRRASPGSNLVNSPCADLALVLFYRFALPTKYKILFHYFSALFEQFKQPTFLSFFAHNVDLKSNNCQQSNTECDHEIHSKFCFQMRQAKAKEYVGN